MSLINSLIQIFTESLSFSEAAKEAEKSKVEGLKNQALQAFKKGYDGYCKEQSITNTVQTSRNINAELVVMLAEAALATENRIIARDILEKFLYADPVHDQFFCRAKLVFAQILDFEAVGTTGFESIQRRKDAVVHIMEALDVATTPDNATRYKFLVYNCSVICWFIVHKFLRNERARHFLPEILRISNALEAIDDTDKDWRIMYLSATAFCLEDDHQNKLAGETVDKAIDIAEKMISRFSNTENSAGNELKTIKKEYDDTLSAIRKLQEKPKEKSKVTTTPIDDKSEIIRLTSHADALQRRKSELNTKLKEVRDAKAPELDRLTKLYMQRINSNVSDGKKITGSSNITKGIRANIMLQLQQIMSGCLSEKDNLTTFTQIITTLESSPPSSLVTEAALDTSIKAWCLKLRDIAIKCSDIAERDKTLTPAIRAKLDTTAALRIIADIDDDQALDQSHLRLSTRQAEGFHTSKRIEAMKLIERVLTTCANRYHDLPFVEEVCVIGWNICIPLLQPHLRKHALTFLQQATTALEQAASSLHFLRAQLHTELAKCEEMNDFLVKAKEEGQKALALDYGLLEDAAQRPPSSSSASAKKKPVTVTEVKRTDELDTLRILDRYNQPFVDVMTLRSDVYGNPSEPEDIVTVMLRQIQESSSTSFQADMLLRASTVLFDLLDNKPRLPVIDTKRKVVPPELTFDDLLKIIRIDRSPSGVTYEPFKYQTQRKLGLVKMVAKLGKMHGYSNIVERCCQYILSLIWNPQDVPLKDFIIDQIDMLFLLAEDLVDRMSCLWFDTEEEEIAFEDAGEDQMDPRSTGVTSKFETLEMAKGKRLLLAILQKALEMSLSIDDIISFQNSLIYYWNLHLHLHRNHLYKLAIPEVFEFIKHAWESIDTISIAAAAVATGGNNTGGNAGGTAVKIDERLRLLFCESLAKLYQVKENLQAALDCAVKGCASDGSVYSKRRVCDLANKLNYELITGKGNKVQEPLKFDHPLLNMLGCLFVAELPDSSIELIKAMATKASTIMNDEVSTLIAAMDVIKMSGEEFNQIVELQVECWTRLTKVRILLDDVHSAQQSAQKCLQFVTDDLMNDNNSDNKLGARAWRWISVCERYFGIAISKLLKADGQVKRLQLELRLAALRHFTLSVQFGHKAGLSDLVIAAAKRAWHINIPLIVEASVRSSLFRLQKQIVDVLKDCTDPYSGVLMQQFYLGMIEGFAREFAWDDALRIIMESFERVPTTLQRPLWKWRVVVLSKKGKNVLEGIQKLREGDKVLQARVYAIIARASSEPKQQLNAYLKAIELLGDDLNRVDYMLETSQWMCTTGIPKEDAAELIQQALEVLYAVDQLHIDEDDEPEGEGGDGVSFVGSRMSSRSKRSSASSRGSRATTGAAKTPSSRVLSRRNSMSSSASGSVDGSGKRRNSIVRSKSKSVQSVRIGDPEEPVGDYLNLKHFDMGLRGAVMLAMLETDVTERVEKCLVAVNFVLRSLVTWSDALQETNKSLQYAKLPILIKESTPLDSYSCPRRDTLDFPSDLVDFLGWEPTTEFTSIMESSAGRCPYEIPTEFSITSVPLTYYYVMWLANALYENNCITLSLKCLSWLRALLFFLRADHREFALAVIYFKSVRILYNCGLAEEAKRLPTKLGSTGIDCFSMVSLISALGQEATAIAEPNKNQFSLCGISCFTEQFSSISKIQCCVDICTEWIALGLGPTAKVALTALHKECLLNGHNKGLVQSASLLAQLAYFSNQPEVTIAVLFEVSSPLREVGDPILFSQHISLLAQAYSDTNQMSVSKNLLLESLMLLKESTVSKLEYPMAATSPGGGVAGGTVSLASIEDKASNTVLKGTKRVDKSGGDSIESIMGGGGGGSNTKMKNTSTFQPNNVAVAEKEKLDINYDSVIGFGELTMVYLSLLKRESLEKISLGEDPRGLLSEINAVSSQCLEIVDGLLGLGNYYAKILRHVAETVLEIVTAVYSMSTAVIPVGVYSDWLELHLTTCLQLLDQSSDILKHSQSTLPYKDRFYLRKLPPSPETGGSLPTFQSIRLQLPHDVMLAHVNHLLGVLHHFRAVTKGDEISINIAPPSQAITIIEKYLEESKQRNEFHLSDFISPSLFNAITSFSSAIEGYRNTDYSIDELIHLNFVNLLKCERNGFLDNVWLINVPYSTSSGDTRGNTQKTDTEAIKRASLSNNSQQHASSALPKSINNELLKIETALTANFSLALRNKRFEVAALASLGIAQLHGKGNTTVAALHFLHYQSIRARTWLLSIWSSSLPPTCAIALSLKRLDQMDRQREFSFISQQARILENSFLLQSSTVWKRLDVTKSPDSILSQLSNHCLLGLTFCPKFTTLYVVAGYIPPENSSSSSSSESSSTSTTSSSTSPNVGTWVVDKIRFTETQRRELQTLLTQHKLWTNDVTKFVSSFGNSYSLGMDLESSTDADKSLRQSEHSLEERLKALTGDLQRLLGALVGPDSMVMEFFRKVAGPPEGTGKEGGREEKAKDIPCVMLLDNLLHSLPFESLDGLKVFRGRVVRDFSLHLLGQRVTTMYGKATQAKAMVTSSAVQVVVDPLKEDDGCKVDGMVRESMTNIIANMRNGHSINGAAKWSLVTSSGPLSLQDWIGISQGSFLKSKLNALASPQAGSTSSITSAAAPNSTLFVQVPGRFGSWLTPRDLSVLNFESIALVCLVDHGHNDNSFRRQCSSDNQKQYKELCLENSTEMIALLSLAGTSCVVAHQWSTAFSSQQRFVSSFWESFAHKKEVLCAAVAAGCLGEPGANLRRRSSAATVAAAAVNVSPVRPSSKSKTGHRPKSRGGAPPVPEPDEPSPAAAPVVSVPKSTVAVELKKWVALAKVVYGMPNITYTDS